MTVKQAQLKVEETRLEATLDALHQERDAEAALAEANVYEAAASEMEVGSIRGSLSQTYNKSENTSDYVKDQFKITPNKIQNLLGCQSLQYISNPSWRLTCLI